MDADVEIQCVYTDCTVPTKITFTHWVNTTLQVAHYQRTESPELTIRIVDSTESEYLNKTWRHCEKPTNVLSFPFESLPGVTVSLLGDIVVCAPIVVEEARIQRKSVEAHWAHLVIHGTLHLLGYDHLEETQAFAMEDLEIAILHRLGYPNPYQT
jgi:probable rRNA maturation factor